MGAWVSSTSYFTQKRHYYIQEGFTTSSKIDRYGRPLTVQTMDSQSLCGRKESANKSTWGGLSIKRTVLLMQKNLCFYCKKDYLKNIAPKHIREAHEKFMKIKISG